jgi:hypothetical protein
MSSKVRSSTATGAESGVGPKLRFPEFQNAKEWRIKKLNSLLYEAKHRNRSLELGPTDVLSVSGEHGCVNQIEFMGRSYAGVTVKDYHVVEHGDIVYTKSPLKRNPYEAWNRFNFVRGLSAFRRLFCNLFGSLLFRRLQSECLLAANCEEGPKERYEGQ